jgi:hypothetical protein
MAIPDQMLSAVLAGTSGAMGSICVRRNVSGLVPGALLALTLRYAISYPQQLWNLRTNTWALVSFLILGVVSAWLAGPRRSGWIDIPLDQRIMCSLLLGCLFNGAIVLSVNC